MSSSKASISAALPRVSSSRLRSAQSRAKDGLGGIGPRAALLLKLRNTRAHANHGLLVIVNSGVPNSSCGPLSARLDPLASHNRRAVVRNGVARRMSRNRDAPTRQAFEVLVDGERIGLVAAAEHC
jgi:hypothetical protein